MILQVYHTYFYILKTYQNDDKRFWTLSPEGDLCRLGRIVEYGLDHLLGLILKVDLDHTA